MNFRLNGQTNKLGHELPIEKGTVKAQVDGETRVTQEALSIPSSPGA